MIPHPQKESTQFVTWRLQVKSQLISYRFRQEIWKNKINNLRGGRREGGGNQKKFSLFAKTWQQCDPVEIQISTNCEAAF